MLRDCTFPQHIPIQVPIFAIKALFLTKPKGEQILFCYFESQIYLMMRFNHIDILQKIQCTFYEIYFSISFLAFFRTYVCPRLYARAIVC